MPAQDSNLRTLELKPGMGKCADDTQLEGMATKTKAEGETNSTEQYKTGKDSAPGPHGGKPNYGK